MNGQLGILVHLNLIQSERQIQTVIKNFWIHGLVIETIEGEVEQFTRMRLVKVRMSRQTRTMITVDEEEEEDDLLQRTRSDGHTTQYIRKFSWA